MQKKLELETRLELKACAICEGIELKNHFTQNGYQVVRCPNCRVEFVNPQPTDMEIAAVYRDMAYHSGERYDTQKKTKQIDQNWQRRLQELQKWVAPDGKLLDVGCATGFFLKNAQAQGWSIQGLEISEEASQEAQKLLGKDVDIQSRDLLDFLTDTHYDVVTLWALIEHVKTPMDYIEKINTILRPEGILALSTPNVNSLTRYLKRRKWRYYIPPEHLYYFDRKNMELALKKCGFRLLAVRTFIRPIAFFNRNSILSKHYNRFRFFRILVKIALAPIVFVVEQFHYGDTMEIYAQKVEDFDNTSDSLARSQINRTE